MPEINDPIEKRPIEIVILGIPFEIQYVNDLGEVDINHQSELYGQVDFVNFQIRLLDQGRSIQHIWLTLMHEILHSIAVLANIKSLQTEEAHGDLDTLAAVLTDTLIRNEWMDCYNTPAIEEANSDG